MRSNTLSSLGRMGYGAHLAFYPTVAAFYVLAVKPYNAKKAEVLKKETWDNMVAAKPVDPDLFNPFTPIPYHNNPDVRAVYANHKMKDYVNQNHINVDEYWWKGYHDSYDHNNKKGFKYNWTSV